MKWNNLKSMKCPKCSDELITNSGGSERMIGCENEEGCGFIMRMSKFEEIVKDIYAGKHKRDYKPQFGDSTENLAILNNLGHEKVAEDFSDSNALNY